LFEQLGFAECIEDQASRRVENSCHYNFAIGGCGDFSVPVFFMGDSPIVSWCTFFLFLLHFVKQCVKALEAALQNRR